MKFNFLEVFKQETKQDPYTPNYFEDDRFHYRILDNEVQVCVKKCFDRWANSVDFVFSVPKTLKAWEKTKARLSKAYDGGHYDRKWGQRQRV